MIKELIKLSNHLDAKGFRAEADTLDRVIIQMSKRAGMPDGNTKELGESQISETIISPRVRSLFERYKNSSEGGKLRTLAQALLLEGFSTFAEIKDAIIQTDPPLSDQGIGSFASQIIAEQNPEISQESAA